MSKLVEKVDSRRELPVYEQEFTFDEALFRQYYLLRLRPHERATGARLLGMALIGFFLVAVMLFSFRWKAEDDSLDSFNPMVPSTWGMPAEGLDGQVTAIAVLFLVLGLLYAGMAVWYFHGRRPDWSRPKWRWHVDRGFAAVREEGCDVLYDRDLVTEGGFLWLIASFVSMNETWDNCNVTLSTFPGGWDGTCRPNAPYEAPLAVRVWPDRLELGGPGGSRSIPWEEAFDLLEGRRFPDVAVLRSERCGEAVLLKGGFGAPWEEVRRYIEGRMREAGRG